MGPTCGRPRASHFDATSLVRPLARPRGRITERLVARAVLGGETLGAASDLANTSPLVSFALRIRRAFHAAATAVLAVRAILRARGVHGAGYADGPRDVARARVVGAPRSVRAARHALPGHRLANEPGLSAVVGDPALDATMGGAVAATKVFLRALCIHRAGHAGARADVAVEGGELAVSVASAATGLRVAAVAARRVGGAGVGCALRAEADVTVAGRLGREAYDERCAREQRAAARAHRCLATRSWASVRAKPRG